MEHVPTVSTVRRPINSGDRAPTIDPTAAAMIAILNLAYSNARSGDELTTVGAGKLTKVPVKTPYRTQNPRIPGSFLIAISERHKTAEANANVVCMFNVPT